MLQGFISAFLTYSKIPMPQIKQSKTTQIYAAAFLPFVGLAIAAFVGVWLYFAPIFHFSQLFITITSFIIPFLITGGVHFSGFVHTNAMIYILFLLAIWYELSPFFTSNQEYDMITICLIMMTFLMSRCLTGLSIVSFPKKEDTDTVSALEQAQKKSAITILLILLFICCLLQFLISPKLSSILLAVGVIFFFYYRIYSLKHGGTTKESTGWFLHMCELLLMTALLIGLKYYY